MHTILHLHHHRHTGKLLPHHHTSYPALILLLVLTIAGLVVIEETAYADSYVVTAKVSAPIPTQPAIITTPKPNSVFASPHIIVQGTCEVSSPNIIIAIYSSDRLLGSTSCDTSGRFTIQITLPVIGDNPLIAKSINITNDHGPDSAVTLVRYTPPTTAEVTRPSPAAQPNNPTRPPAAMALTISSRYAYLLFGPDKKATWQGFVDGGSPPYTIAVDWGDGTEQKIVQSDHSELLLHHSYRYTKNYSVVLTVVDSTGNSTSQRLIATSPYRPDMPSGITETTDDRQLIIIGLFAVGLLIVITTLAWIDVEIRKTKHAHRQHLTVRAGKRPTKRVV